MSRRKRTGHVNGLILVDKPSGMTSFDVVARLRKIFGVRRIGHTGTLDPMATGLMAVLIGQATKLAPFITATHKAYRATATLGVATNTYDADGEPAAESPREMVANLVRDRVAAELAGFQGRISQRPPAFSAIKVDGERLYAKARRGEEVIAPMRDVEVYSIQLDRFELPQVDFSIECSKGTYIRSIAHDLGQRLEVGAHLSALRRTAVGQFRIEDAWSLETLATESRDACLGALKPLRVAVAHLPALQLSEPEVAAVRHGKRFQVDFEPSAQVQAISPEGKLVAIVEVSPTHELRVIRGIPLESATT